MNRRLAAQILAVSVSGVAFSGAAMAAAAGRAPDHSTAIFVAQIVLLLVTGRAMGEWMHRIGQPAIMGQLLAGIILGPSLFGAVFPQLQAAVFPNDVAQKKMLDAVSQLGILMLLLLTGMETDLALIARARRAAISASLAGIAVPFACGLAVGWLLPESMLPHPDRRLVTALFIGTALSIASVKIVAAVVREMNFMRRRVGQIIVVAAIIDDTVGWIIISVIFGITAHGSLDLLQLTKSVASAVGFLAFSWYVGRPAVIATIRFANDKMESEFAVITVILIITGAMALITDLLGLHTVLGAFVAGILIGQSPILTRHIDEELRGLIVALFMPIFFAVAGLGTDLTILADPRILLLSIAFILIASVGKFAGAFIGGELGALNRHESLALAFGMNARGSTEVIVATIGLGMGALSRDLFSMIVVMAVVTTMAMPPTLRWALRRIPVDQIERSRLDREDAHAKAFVPNLERLLVAVDGSGNGRFAARLASLLAGSRGIITTALHVGGGRTAAEPAAADADAKAAPALREEAATIGQAMRSVAEAAVDRGETKKDDSSRFKLDVEVVAPADAAHEAVARQSRKGYGLIMVGLDAMKDKDGAIASQAALITTSFKGPAALVIGAAEHLQRPGEAPLDILVPVSGTDYSARAAEVAFVLAKAANAKVTILYVSIGAAKQPWYQRIGAPVALMTNEMAILHRMRELAEHFDITPTMATAASSSLSRAIFGQLRGGKHNVVVLGVTPRQGDALFFGNSVQAVLAKADRSVILVSS